MNGPTLRAVRTAWRLVSPGTWEGYGGVQVRERVFTNGSHFEALGKSGRPLFVRRKLARVFDTAERAFEAVESLIMRSARQHQLLGTELDQVLEEFEFNEVPKL